MTEKKKPKVQLQKAKIPIGKAAIRKAIPHIDMKNKLADLIKHRTVLLTNREKMREKMIVNEGNILAVNGQIALVKEFMDVK